MSGFRTQGEKIPDVIGLLNVGVRIALLGVDKIRKFKRIPNKKDRCIVADQIVVTLLGVKLDCESSGIAHGVGRTFFSSYGGESDENLGSLSDWSEKIGLGPA